MATLTRIPAVIDGLVSVFTAALAGVTPAVVVMDGPQTGEPPYRAVLVGASWRGQQPYSVNIVRDPSFGRPMLTEQWQVRCFLTVQTTSDAFPPARDAVADLLAVLDGAVRANTRTDAWDSAEISGQAEWVPELTKVGAACSIVFTVNGSGLL